MSLFLCMSTKPFLKITLFETLWKMYLSGPWFTKWNIWNVILFTFYLEIIKMNVTAEIYCDRVTSSGPNKAFGTMCCYTDLFYSAILFTSIFHFSAYSVSGRLFLIMFLLSVGNLCFCCCLQTSPNFSLGLLVCCGFENHVSKLNRIVGS